MISSTDGVYPCKAVAAAAVNGDGCLANAAAAGKAALARPLCMATPRRAAAGSTTQTCHSTHTHTKCLLHKLLIAD